MNRHPSGRVRRVLPIAFALALSLSLGLVGPGRAKAETAEVKLYNVVLNGTMSTDGFTVDGDVSTLIALVEASGGTVTNDLSDQIGALTIASADPLITETLKTSSLVEDVGEDFVWKNFLSAEESQGALQDQGEDGQCPDPPDPNDPDCVPPGVAVPANDPFEELQWDMEQICATGPDPEWETCNGVVHAEQDGEPLVDVGILDTGIDGDHVDFFESVTGPSNVDCSRGRNSIVATADLLVIGPGVSVPDPCTDDNFHGTHVAGTVAAATNGVGIVGVAPDVTLVPVKVCDSTGHCYASAVTDGIVYAGDQRFDVINMSFFVDDDVFLQSTEYKCMDDPVQRTFRKMVERAIQYARNQGVTPVAALGNSDNDLAHPPEPYENDCDVVPAETEGVIGTMALGRNSEKAYYSNYGSGAVDVAAPGGSGGTVTGFCTRTILSTFPNNTYACIQGTSMASPHTAGVAALIVSEYGKVVEDTGGDYDDDPSTASRPPYDVEIPPTKVESYLQNTTIDIGLSGYDECFGNGRLDAYRAVIHDTQNVYDEVPPCPEYAE